MRNPRDKDYLIKTVMKQIEMDVHCNDVEAIEELLKFLPNVNLIEYLPEEDQSPFKHLRDETN